MIDTIFPFSMHLQRTTYSRVVRILITGNNAWKVVATATNLLLLKEAVKCLIHMWMIFVYELKVFKISRKEM